MAHIALYRALRPQTFRDMVGQPHIVQTLQNAIREDRLSHAYLFSGPRGTGKTSTARLLAKAINCERGPTPEPCNECESCKRITAGSVMDVVEIDAASNRGVEEIRDIRDKVKYAPTEVRRKVYIIDEVHMLTTEAFNALLKTLEEPPAHVMFMLATTEPHRLPPTIISRCQRFEFRRVSLEEQAEWLQDICRKEGIRAEDEALVYISRLSDGGMRDALSLLDQISSFTGGQVTLHDAVEATGGLPSEQFGRLAAAVRDSDAAAVLREVDEMMRAGKSADKCLEQLMHYFRDLLLAQLAPQAAASAGRVAAPGELRAMAEGFPRERLFSIIDVLNRYQAEMKYAAHPQTMFEIALLKLCASDADAASADGAAQAASAPPRASAAAGGADLQRLQQQVAHLERRLEELQRGGGIASASAQAGGGAAGGLSARGRGSAPGAAPAKSLRSRVKLDPFLAARGAPNSLQALSKWPQVLQRVKEERVTVHAWLVDGEPVSYADDTVLVAFRNTIHRETTEKPANKQVIEGVLSALLGHPTQLATVTQKEWQDALAAGGGALREEAAAEELRLVPEDGGEPAGEPLVDEAVRLFGEELVVIKDE
ncbi:DNA polymerase III subunit gamma/tau [Cohnella lubricantis]|uniref:DNA-directed DNA polymerase n=1 Tax=Cohnella lubricantis TaxID=2163172 RepID=A0A841TLX6_9BACL|nr:DNA polymerase III subunit gamma/tau [Cohnella lubricantis]MBB6679541.1 DNA polymerase III subunit gamma/tau [Cohnella lubricantis]MBP2118224.1 DNA polymerase-3 subunit gamma/tau [Cohnella lubricantis]